MPALFFLRQGLQQSKISVFVMEMPEIGNRNELDIVRAVLARDNRATRQDILKQVPFGSSKTAELLKDLRSRNVLLHHSEKSLTESNRGRGHHIYGVNPELGSFLGAAVNNVYDRLALVDFSGSLIATKEYEPSYKAEKTIPSLLLHIQDFLQEYGSEQHQLRGITLGLHGVFDEKTGTLYRIPNYGGDVIPNTRQEIARFFNVPVYISHAKYLLMLNRFRFSSDLNRKNILNLHHGYGVGMGISIRGHFFEGSAGLSGEIGHIKYPGNERRCYCGQVGCLRTIVSYQGIVDQVLGQIENGTPTRADSGLLKNSPFETGVKHIVDLAIEKDTLCTQIVYETGNRLGNSLGTAITLFNPDVLVVHSDLSRVGELFTAPLRLALQSHSLTQSVRELQIEFEPLEPFAAPIGGGLMGLRNQVFGQS